MNSIDSWSIQDRKGWRRLFSVTLMSGCALGVSPALLAQTPSSPVKPDEVASRLIGDLIYDQTDRPDIRMRTCQVNVNPARSNSIYLYQEQASVDSLKKPYRQRFLRLYPSEQIIVSESFRPIQAEQWVGLCDDKVQTKQVQLTDFQPPHCSVYLQKKEHVWVGKTPKEGCPSRFRGASFVRNKIILSSDGMKTFDQGFDADGNLVWGSDGKPYVFVRVPVDRR